MEGYMWASLIFFVTVSFCIRLGFRRHEIYLRQIKHIYAAARKAEREIKKGKRQYRQYFKQPPVWMMMILFWRPIDSFYTEYDKKVE